MEELTKKLVLNQTLSSCLWQRGAEWSFFCCVFKINLGVQGDGIKVGGEKRHMDSREVDFLV